MCINPLSFLAQSKNLPILCLVPIIKSAIKRMKQTKTRTARRLPYKSRMKTMMKKVLGLAEAGKKDEAAKALPEAMKCVDMAAKRHIIHKKNADRKKSRMCRAVAQQK